MDEAQRKHRIHMAMLQMAGSAKNYGELTVVLLGHAVSVAERLIQEATNAGCPHCSRCCCAVERPTDTQCIPCLEGKHQECVGL